jgi:hypothetical protein
MAGSAQRPKKPESRDGCVSRMRSLQLQKSPTPDFEEKCGNSPDISKGISQTGMWEFDPSEVSHAFSFSENFLSLIRKARQMRAFLIANGL